MRDMSGPGPMAIAQVRATAPRRGVTRTRQGRGSGKHREMLIFLAVVDYIY